MKTRGLCGTLLLSRHLVVNLFELGTSPFILPQDFTVSGRVKSIVPICTNQG